MTLGASQTVPGAIDVQMPDGSVLPLDPATVESMGLGNQIEVEMGQAQVESAPRSPPRVEVGEAEVELPPMDVEPRRQAGGRVPRVEVGEAEIEQEQKLSGPIDKIVELSQRFSASGARPGEPLSPEQYDEMAAAFEEAERQRGIRPGTTATLLSRPEGRRVPSSPTNLQPLEDERRAVELLREISAAEAARQGARQMQAEQKQLPKRMGLTPEEQRRVDEQKQPLKRMRLTPEEQQRRDGTR